MKKVILGFLLGALVSGITVFLITRTNHKVEKPSRESLLKLTPKSIDETSFASDQLPLIKVRLIDPRSWLELDKTGITILLDDDGDLTDVENAIIEDEDLPKLLEESVPLNITIYIRPRSGYHTTVTARAYASVCERFQQAAKLCDPNILPKIRIEFVFDKAIQPK